MHRQRRLHVEVEPIIDLLHRFLGGILEIVYLSEKIEVDFTTASVFKEETDGQDGESGGSWVPASCYPEM